jgi:hypothetical protein
VIERLLSKEPADRPSEAKARRMLEGVSSGGSAAPAAMTALAAGADTVPEERVEERTPTGDIAEPAPAWRPGSQDRRPDRHLGGWLVAAGVLAVAAVIAVLALSGLFDREGDDTPAGAGRRQDRGSNSGPGGGNREGEGDGGEAAEDLQTYTDPSGWSIDYPADWGIEPQSVDADSVDIADPAGGRYLRVDWTDQPGPDAMEALEGQAPNFGNQHSNYQEIQLTPTTFAGSDNAGLWEYSYEDGGASLHAYNLQFVTSDGGHGFALNFQTTEEQWEASQDLWGAFMDSFEAP